MINKCKDIFIQKRNVWQEVDGIPVYTELETVGTVLGLLQQASPQFAMTMNLDFKKTYTFYTAETDIQEGDLFIVDETSEEFTVSGISTHSHPGIRSSNTRVILSK